MHKNTMKGLLNLMSNKAKTTAYLGATTLMALPGFAMAADRGFHMSTIRMSPRISSCSASAAFRKPASLEGAERVGTARSWILPI